MRLRDVALGFAAGVAIAGVSTVTCYDRQVAALQAHADSVATAAAASTARTLAWGDSVRRAARQHVEAARPIVAAAASDSQLNAQLAASLADERTTADSNAVLHAQVRALERQTRSLWVALAHANAATALEAQRGDSLAKVTALLNHDIQELRARIGALRPPPTWVRVAGEVAKIGGALYAGYQAGRHCQELRLC